MVSTVECPEWVVKREGLYWEDEDGEHGERWGSRQWKARRFIERANAREVAARTGGRIFRLIPMPSNSEESKR